MLLATLCFACMNAGQKLLGGNYPPQEIAFFRFLFGFIPIAPLVMRQGTHTLKTKRVFGHLWRALAGVVVFSLMVTALETQPLGDVMSVYYADSLFLVALSGPILREKVGLHSWIAVIVGFAGALIIMHPGGGISLGIGIALFAGLINALTTMWIRTLARTELPLTILFYLSIFGTAIAGLATVGSFVTPVPHDLVLMVGLGLAGGCGQYCFNIACRYAPTSVTAPYTYAILVWSMILQWAIWHAPPSLATIGGAAMIVGGSLYVFFHERKRKAELADAVALEAVAD